MSRKILVVDDSTVARKVIKTFITKSKIEVLEADNGEVALHLLAHHKVDLVVCDLNMPEINGLELIAKLKQNPGTMRIPVAMITSESSFKTIEKAKELGVVAFLVKPISHDQINTLLKII